MPFTIRAQLKGVDDLVRQLDALKRGRSRIMRKALTKGAKLIVAAARRKVPTRYGLLKKSLGVAIRSYRGGERLVAVIGPRAGFRVQVGTVVRGGIKSKPGDPIMADPVKYAHLVEFGHGGAHPAPAHPFLRPALDETGGEVMDAIRNSIIDDLAKLASGKTTAA